MWGRYEGEVRAGARHGMDGSMSELYVCLPPLFPRSPGPTLLPPSGHGAPATHAKKGRADMPRHNKTELPRIPPAAGSDASLKRAAAMMKRVA